MTDQVQPTSDYRPIRMDQLAIAESNVRRRDITADLDQLAHSMRTIGLQQPIVVQEKGDGYAILIGQRRYLAAKQLGWEEIPAQVLGKAIDDFEAKVLSFSENVQRRELSPRDKADACSYLLDQLGTVKAVAEHLGVSEPTVRKWLQYAVVPERLKSMVEAKQITRQVATRIAQHVPDETRAAAIAEKIVEEGPTPGERERILEAVEEFPDRSVEVILERAQEKRIRKEITFVLPERWAVALERASKAFDADASDIARTATIEWLEAREY